MKQLDQTTRETIQRMLAEGRTHREVARALGISIGSVSKYAAASPEGLQTDRLRERIRDLEERLARKRSSEVSFEEVRELIHGLVAAEPPQPDWTIEPQETGRSAPSVPVVMTGDWHLGETIEPGEINGLNRYNSEIAEARVRELASRVVHLCKDHMVRPDYPGIVAPIMGDIVSGEIHEELARTNDRQPLESVLDAVGLLAWFLRTMADEFGRVFAPCVSGNHGRHDRKPPAKRLSARNFDWLIYQLVKRELRNDPRVVIRAPEANWNLFRIYGHTFLQLHGDNLGVKGGDGIIGALGPILRGSIKVSHQFGGLGIDYDTLLIGHWHQALQIARRVIVSGALKGPDEFAMQRLRAAPEPPTQPLFFVHPARGITAMWPVYLETGYQRRTRTEPRWVSWEE